MRSTGFRTLLVPRLSINADDAVLALAVSGSTVYAGGFFSAIGGQARNRIVV